MKWLIIGAGAIGCLVGGKLAAHGADVTLVGRPRFAETVRQQGLVLTDAQGVQTVHTLQIAASIVEAYQHAVYDLAVFTVKSYDTGTALAELQQAATGHVPSVLSLQNGVGNEETLAAALGAEHVLAGTITTPVSITGPGAITIEKPNFTVGLSPWTAHFPVEHLARVDYDLTAAGFAVTRYPHPEGLKWTKLLMNMVGNATSAILDEPPGRVFADPALVDVEIAAWREALAVMARARIPSVNLGQYPFALLAPLIRTLPNALLRPVLRRQVRGARGAKWPSLHIDLHGGKAHNEVGWLNGAVTKRGATLGVPTPINTVLTETLLTLVSNEAEHTRWHHNHAHLIQACHRAMQSKIAEATGL
jgi:2-dehydropantoate 2-reductase